MPEGYHPKIRSGYYIKNAQTHKALAHSIETYLQIEGRIVYHVEPFRSDKLQDDNYIYREARDRALSINNPCPNPPQFPQALPDPLTGLQSIAEWCREVEKMVFLVRQAIPKVDETESQEKVGQSKTNIPDYKALTLAKVPISRLIEQGESHTLEFKEIPECNTQQNRKNNDVLFPPLKTIAGFLNAEGGILLIGVDNSGKIVGIEPYLNTMEQGNNDTFEQQIRNCLRDRFEPYPIGKVKVSFKKFMEGTVCRIDVQADKEPVNLDNKIYVRDGNTTQLLKGRRLTDWIQQRRLLTALPSGK